MKPNSESVVAGVLQDELDRNRRIQARYRQEIAQLPKGSLYLRTINHQQYYYLSFRQKDKNVAQYQGKSDDVRIQGIRKKIEQRKHYEALLKKLSNEEKLLLKALR